ncbi:MAG: tetratricopeptide repeat protein [Chloracidobacterium sp.]|nr:tetratricopeptide repeat protein [Chloracidobacterium sp.]
MHDKFISREQAQGDMLSAAAFLAENIKSSDGHGEAMNVIVPLYLAKNDVDLAAELSNQIAEPFARDKLLMQIAEKCAELDDDEYAVQLADAIEEHGLRAQAIEHVAQVKAAKGQIEKAREMAAPLAHPDFVLAGIAVRQAADGNDAGADATVEEIDFPLARAAALSQIAAAKIADEKGPAAEGYLERAVAAALEIDHDEEQIRSLCDVGNLYIEAGRKDKAVETYEEACSRAEVLDNVHREFFLVNCALGFLYADDHDRCDRALDLVTDKTQMASALLAIARDEWEKGAKDDAVDSLDEAYEILRSQRDIETRDSRARNSLMGSIGVQFAGFGKTERGVQIADENQDPAETSKALTQIARILTVQNEPDLARQTVESIEEDADRLFALIGVADEKEKQGDAEAAMALYEEAATLVETVPQMASRSGALNLLAMRFIGHDQRDRARELTLESLDVVSEIKDESSQAVALAGLASVYDAANLDLGDVELDKIHKLVQSTGW